MKKMRHKTHQKNLCPREELCLQFESFSWVYNIKRFVINSHLNTRILYKYNKLVF